MKYTPLTTFDYSNRVAGVSYYPIRKQFKIGNRIASLYSLLGGHPGYSFGVDIFDAETGANEISLGYFIDEAYAMKRIKRHFKQLEQPDTYEFTCHGKTCCNGEPIQVRAFTLAHAKRIMGTHWHSSKDFKFIQFGS
jgi:hypothetical protein